MGATIGKIMGATPAKLPRVPSFRKEPPSFDELLATARWFVSSYLPYRNDKVFLKARSTDYFETAHYRQAWREEYDRRFLLRPAAFVDTNHSLLVRPSCK